MEADQTNNIKKTIEDAIIGRLKELFDDPEKGTKIINEIRDKVLAEEINLDDIISNFELNNKDE